MTKTPFDYPYMFNKNNLDHMFDLMGGNREHIAEGFFWSFRYLWTGSIEGDYLEFGVANGRTFANAYVFGTYPKEKYGCGKFPDVLAYMHFYGFDSFEGLPEPHGHDAEVELQSDFVQGAYNSSVVEVKANMAELKADFDRITLVEGWYEDTLTDENRAELGIEKAALVHVDCDLYESAVLALDFVTPILVPGSIIMFDDYLCNNANPNAGERKAFSDWQKKNPRFDVFEYRKYSTHAVSFIVNPPEEHFKISKIF